MMLPRSKSIFNIGEEVEEEVNKATLANGGGPEGLVGLRIAIQHHGRGSNIVINPTLKSRRSVDRSWRPPKSLPEIAFLKRCMLCMKELSLQKEIYMYRGDEGFCSVECRGQRILVDERREFEASKRDQSKLRASYHHRAVDPKIGKTDARKRILAAA